jgi:hypothetical protein
MIKHTAHTFAGGGDTCNAAVWQKGRPANIQTPQTTSKESACQQVLMQALRLSIASIVDICV